MKFHKYAELFPPMSGAAFDELVENIRVYGVRSPIVIYQGQILDGRNRYLAAQKAGIRHRDIPKTRPKLTDAGALEFVVSANFHRRHLTESQRAMVAARIATAHAGDNQHSEQVVPTGTAAKLLNASVRSTKRAKRVLANGSADLQHAVDAGELSVSRAAAVVDLPASEQLSAARTSVPTPEPDVTDNWEPPEDEDERIAAIEREQARAIDKVMNSSDHMAAAKAEIERQAAEIATLKITSAGYQDRCGVLTRMVKSLRRRLERIEAPAGSTKVSKPH